jgi:hypothetical protein
MISNEGFEKIRRKPTMKSILLSKKETAEHYPGVASALFPSELFRVNPEKCWDIRTKWVCWNEPRWAFKRAPFTMLKLRPEWVFAHKKRWLDRVTPAFEYVAPIYPKWSIALIVATLLIQFILISILLWR